MTEVKKHFTIQKLIDDYNYRLKPMDDTDVELVSLRVCDVCKKARKAANSFCKVCEEFLCTDCQTAHKGSKATKDHKLVDFQQLCEENQRDIRRQMKKLQDTKIDVQQKGASTKKVLKQIVESEGQVIAEINRYRKAIIKKVDQHHDQLIEEVKSINESLQETLKQTEDMLEQYERNLDDKVSLLSQVSESSDYSVTMDILSNLSQQIEKDLQQIRSDLAKVNPDALSTISVLEGEEFDPIKSTRINTIQSIVEPPRELRSHAMVCPKL